jgi:hypothetical protein
VHSVRRDWLVIKARRARLALRVPLVPRVQLEIKVLRVTWELKV